MLLKVVQALDAAPTARAACATAGLKDEDLPAYAAALATLARTDMIRERPGRPAGEGAS
jgi:mycofactocin biosynthesis protein MftB